jgi:lipopolysaccharide export system protein LptC
VMLTSRQGTFTQHQNLLDLVKDVTLYRDDGTTLHTESASIDLKAGVAAGSDHVHAEGPFGVLDAQGFAVMDKGAAIDFAGPAHLVLNGAEH